jgi:hypothetical protein
MLLPNERPSAVSNEIPDEAIDTSEVPELGKDFFIDAALTRPGESLITSYERPAYLTEEQREYIQGLGIPVDSDHPGTYWIACVSYESVMPTEAELRMIRSYIEYAVKSCYNQTYQDKIFAKSLPAEGGHTTKIFRKGARWQHQPDPLEGWVYRRLNWEGGHWPQWPAPRVSLLEILDHMHTSTWNEKPELFPQWVKWKAEHPDIFPPV